MEGQVLFKPDGVSREFWTQLDWSSKKEARKVVKEARSYQKDNKGEYDFFLKPVPLPVPDNMIASGTGWHCDYLEVPANADRLSKLAKGKFYLAILDTGEPDFPGLTRYAYPGKQPTSYTGEPVRDGHSHSTHITGTYGHKDALNQTGVLAGLEGRFFMDWYKVCTNGGGCSHSWIAQAVLDVLSFYESDLKPKGIRAGVTMSLGGGSPSQQVIDAVQKALDAGLFVFASSGNNGRPDISFPAQIEGVVALGAHDKNGNKASFSNWGNSTEELFGVGPGVSIYSTCKNGEMCVMSGTSMGNPIYNAVVVATAMARPDWPVSKVLSHVAQNSFDLDVPGYDAKTGNGTPKLGRILDNIGDTPAPPTDPTCDDGKRNGDEEGVDCGGSCPPCEVSPPDDPGAFPERVLQVKLKGEWKAAWSVMGQAEMANNSVSVVDIRGLMGYSSSGKPFISAVKPQSSQWRWITITDISIRIKSTESAKITAEQVRGLMDRIWNGGRGIGMAAPADFDKAGRYVAYFTDLLSDRFYGGFDITVEEITFRNDLNHTMSYRSDELWQWPRDSDPFVNYEPGIPEQYDMWVHEPKVANEKRKWKITATWFKPTKVEISQKGLPEFSVTVPNGKGVHETYAWSEGKPTREQISKKSPYGKPWQLGDVLEIIPLPKK